VIALPCRGPSLLISLDEDSGNKHSLFCWLCRCVS
jgi:hypothetical protein